ncbi:MAG TPA: TfoX/Sxy family protein [Bosea sp. (in: a-proteobacteria)]
MKKRSSQEIHLADHFVELLADWANVTTRPLFGAVALYRADRVFAMVWHGALYFKVDRVSQKEYESAGSKALSYVSSGENYTLKSYWEVPADVIEDGAKLCDWAERAYQVALKTK